MPVKWQFKDRNTGEAVSLGVVNEQIQTASGGKCGVDEIAMNGVSVLANSDDVFEISEDGMKTYCEKWGPDSELSLPDWLIPILWRFLFEDYAFSAWR